MSGRAHQIWVLSGLAAMIAMFCLFVAYLSLSAFGNSVASLFGIAAMFSSVVFSVSAWVVRRIKRQLNTNLASPTV